jgi:hypothetical protein
MQRRLGEAGDFGRTTAGEENGLGGTRPTWIGAGAQPFLGAFGAASSRGAVLLVKAGSAFEDRTLVSSKIARLTNRAGIP